MSPWIPCLWFGFSPLCVFKWVLKSHAWTDAKSHWLHLFSTVRFEMRLQIVCQRGCKVALVAFVWLFSTVRLQMCPQMACLRGCVITLVAFTWPHPSFITVLGSSQFRVFNVFFHHYWVLKNICEEKGKVGVLTSTPLMYPGNWCGLRSVFCGNILTKVRVWFW